LPGEGFGGQGRRFGDRFAGETASGVADEGVNIMSRREAFEDACHFNEGGFKRRTAAANAWRRDDKLAQGAVLIPLSPHHFTHELLFHGRFLTERSTAQS
jgi:hypothetical protein